MAEPEASDGRGLPSQPGGGAAVVVREELGLLEAIPTLESRPPITAGRYRMVPVVSGGGGVIAKMDELLVELAVVPEFALAPAG